jgi:hypothetical protein
MAAYLRIMSGASYYLDVFMIYDMKTKHLYNSFEKYLGWVNDTFTLLLVKALQAFSQASNGIYGGFPLIPLAIFIIYNWDGQKYCPHTDCFKLDASL